MICPLCQQSFSNRRYSVHLSNSHSDAFQSKNEMDLFAIKCRTGLTDEIIEELDSEEAECQRCGSPLENGLCSDETCLFAEYHQDDQRGWEGHPNPPTS